MTPEDAKLLKGKKPKDITYYKTAFLCVSCGYNAYGPNKQNYTIKKDFKQHINSARHKEKHYLETDYVNKVSKMIEAVEELPPADFNRYYDIFRVRFKDKIDRINSKNIIEKLRMEEFEKKEKAKFYRQKANRFKGVV